MFQKKQTGEPTPGSDATTIIAAGTRAIGDFECANHLRIDGQIEGNIQCNSKVVVGQSGKVNGMLHCANADISGHVYGDIQATESLILRQSALVYGNIQAQMLQMEAGVTFNGKCHMGGQSETPIIAKPKNKKHPVLVTDEDE